MIATLGLAGILATQSAADFLVISGKAVHREKIALPAGAVLVVSLDSFGKDGQANVAEVSQTLSGKQSPLPFQLSVLRSSLKKGNRFGLRAEIVVNGKRIFETGPAVMIHPDLKTQPVLYMGKVQPVRAWSMADKDWTLFAVEGKRIELEGEAPSIRFDSKGGKISGFTGVNRYFGTYASTAPSMQIDPGGMTKMAGEESQMRLETTFVGLLEKVNRATVEEGELVLSRGGKELLRFRAAK